MEKGAIIAGQAQTSQAIASTITAFIDDIITRESWAADLIGPASGDEHEIRHRLADLRATTPGITSTAYLALDGRVIASDPPGIPDVDLSDRPFFKQIVDDHKKWAVSDLLTSRWDGSFSWVVASAVEDNGGRLIGLLVATFSPESFQKAISVDFNKNGSYAIVDSDGRAVWVSNFPNLSWDERDWRWIPAVGPALGGKVTTFEGLVSRIDRVPRLGAFAPISGFNWAVGVAMPEEEALGVARAHIIVELGTLLLAAILSIAAGIVSADYFTGHLRNLSHHATELAGGNLSLRVNLRTRDELQDLANAFN